MPHPRLVLGFGALGSFGALGIGALVGYELFAPDRAPSSSAAAASASSKSPSFDPKASAESFSSNSSSYDKSIDRDELLMGIKLLRWYLIRNFVTGNDALEVSAGTGRNLGYYGNGLSLTLADANREMLIEAAAKARDASEQQDAGSVALYLADSENLVRPDSDRHGRREPTQAERSLRSLRTFPPESFDTVVDTFGLCSLNDPRKALEQMVSVVRPGGRIILLEHGRGTWRLINDILSAQEKNHFERWGCNFNRDLDAEITRLVDREGLRVVWRARWHFGTTLICVLERETERPRE